MNSGFEIMITNDDCGMRNHFVIDRDIFGDIPLPPPPKHFVYGKIDRLGLCFYRLIIDRNDPPASLLRLSKMSIKKLKAIASKNDLRGWEDLSKTGLIRFLKNHRYIFPDDFYKQQSLPNHQKRWWWKGLPLAGSNEKRLFLSKPNSFAMFEREMDSRFSEIAGNVAEPIRDRLRQSYDTFSLWTQEWVREWEAMKKKIRESDAVWSKEEKDLFFSQLEESLEKKVLQVGV